MIAWSVRVGGRRLWCRIAADGISLRTGLGGGIAVRFRPFGLQRLSEIFAR
jgi:hypothetical protein